MSELACGDEEVVSSSHAVDSLAPILAKLSIFGSRRSRSWHSMAQPMTSSVLTSRLHFRDCLLDRGSIH